MCLRGSDRLLSDRKKALELAVEFVGAEMCKKQTLRSALYLMLQGLLIMASFDGRFI